jgi:hypothetical protein
MLTGYVRNAHWERYIPPSPPTCNFLLALRGCRFTAEAAHLQMVMSVVNRDR